MYDLPGKAFQDLHLHLGTIELAADNLFALLGLTVAPKISFGVLNRTGGIEVDFN